MAFIALLSGIASLLAIPLFHLLKQPGPLDFGALLAVLAIATGVLGRKQQAGKAGVILGILGLASNAYYLKYLITMRMVH